MSERVRNAEFRDDGTIVHYVACWNCLLHMCPGGPHDWADEDDIEHARLTDQPDPTGQPCNCTCASGPVLEEGPEREWDESLDLAPCPICGAEAACGYDADGRPLIHALGEEEGEE
jgi:hypothetical protein